MLVNVVFDSLESSLTRVASRVSTIRILLAASNAQMRDYVQRLLNQRYEVETVADGVAALVVIRQKQPDLVLIDAMMLGVDELLAELRADSQAGEIPILLLSGRSEKEAGVEGLDVGANDYPDEPFSVGELLVRIEANVKIAQMRREATCRERALRVKSESEQRYRSLIAATASVVWTTDAKGEFVNPQESWEAYTGQSWQDYAGWGWLQAIHPDDRDRIQTLWTQALAQQTTYESSGRIWHAASGQYRDFVARGVPLLSPDGSVREWAGMVMEADNREPAMVGAFPDLTNCEIVEELLKDSSERLRLAIEASDLGMWDYNLVSGQLVWSEQCKLMFGIAPEVDVSYEIFLHKVYPEDRERVNRAVMQSISDRDDYDIEYRILWADDTVRWIAAIGRAYYDDNGTPTRMVGVTLDISARKQTEEALRQSEERLRVALKNSPITIFNQDRELRYTWIYNNPDFGYQPEEVIGKRDVDLRPAVEAEVLKNIKRQVLETGVGAREEVKLTLYGQDWYYDLTVEPLRDANNEVMGVTCAAIDISDRKHAELALSKSQTLLNALLASSPIAIAFLDGDLRYIHANEALAAINGLPLSEHLGRTLWDILPGWAPQLAPIFQQVMQTKQPLLNQEIRGATNPPELCRHSLVNYYPVCLPDGEVLGVGVTAMDITELKRTEQALRESESRFRRMADGAAVFIWMSGTDGHCTYFNQPWLEFVGQSLEEALATGWSQGLHPDDKESSLNAFLAAFNARQRFQLEYRHRRKDGEYRWVLDQGVPLFNEDGSFAGYIGSGIDISDRKVAERRQQLLVELNDALRTISDPQEIMWEAACCVGKHFGVARCAYGEIDAAQEYVTIYRDFCDGVNSIMGRHRLNDFGFQLVVEAKQGKTLVIDNAYTDPRTANSIAAFDAIETKGAVCVPLVKQGRFVALFALHDKHSRTWQPEEVKLVEDVAERTWAAVEKARAQDALRQSEARFQRLATNVPGVIFRYVLYRDGSDAIPYISPSCRNLFELEPETIQENVDRLWALIHPEDVPSLREAITISAQTEQSLCWEGRYIMPSGCTKWFQITSRPERQADGSVLWDGLLTDITNQKEAARERERLLAREQAAREQAEAANRIKDEFLAVLSHELRSPLNPILGWTTLLRSRKFDEKATDRALETIERNAKLQTQLIEDLLDVSHILRGKMALDVAPVNLVTTIEAALETVRLAAQAKEIQIQTIFDARVGRVAGDANRLQQVVWNLLFNAVKFTPPGGRVDVELKVCTLKVEGSQELESWKVGELESLKQPSNLETLKPSNPKQPSNLETLKPSNPKQPSNLETFKPSDPEQPSTQYVQIQVKDNGKGISPEFLPHIFEYFRQENGSSTRKFGGLGLGLAIVRHLVELHGGSVWAESPGEGLGATFTVRLPLMVEREEVAGTDEPCDRSIDLSGLHVLVVEDEADIRELVAFILEEFGAEVAVAASAGEALIALNESVPDVLLSDIGMPEVDGYMLMRQVRGFPPERGGQVCAIALTAYAGEYDRHQALQAGFQLHVPKPVEPNELVGAIARLVGRA